MLRLQVVMTVLLVGFLGGTTAGCSTVGTGAADALVPIEEENRLGREIASELEQELEFSDDRQLAGYVELLGREVLAETTEREGLEFEFHLVDDDEMINAFAIPGGGIYIYTGLIKAMDNEAELTAVLGHEIAHVTRRHIAQRLVAIYGIEVVSQMALGQEAGLLAQLVTAIVQQGFMLSYSREHERDADRWGVRYQAAAGWNPEGFVTFFQKLEDQPSPPTFLSTHPPPAERIENIRRHIDDLDQVPTELGEERFERMRGRI